MSPFPKIARDGGRSSRAGFTLIEVLVAMSVLALVASVILRDVVGLRAASLAASERGEASLVARSVLGEMEANRRLKAGTVHGQTAGRHWTVVASPMNLKSQFSAPTTTDNATTASPAQAAAVPPPVDWEPQRLVVTVDTRGRPVTAEAIHLVRPR